MAASNRSTLRMPRSELISELDDHTIDVGVHDILIPCRSFPTDYQVVIQDGTSPSLEFLLRTVKAMPGIDEDQLGAFFGYSERELEHVIEEGRNPGYVELRDGRLYLTASGESLFKDKSGEPSILVIENRRRNIGLDLISFAPQDKIPIGKFETYFPELPICDMERSANASSEVPRALIRYFRELGDPRDREPTHRRELYSVDNVEPGARFVALARVRVKAKASAPDVIRANIDGWRPDHEQLDRTGIVLGLENFVNDIGYVKTNTEITEALSVLKELALKDLKIILDDNQLTQRSLWSAAVRSDGPKPDEQTKLIAGSIFDTKNLKLLSNFLHKGANRHLPLPYVICVRPKLPLWGSTSQMRDLLELLMTNLHDPISNTLTDPITVGLGLQLGDIDQHINHLFNENLFFENERFPTLLEIFLVPGCVVVASIHAPVEIFSGYPIPCGLISCDPDVVNNAQRMIARQVDPRDGDGDFIREMKKGLVTD